MRACVKFLEKQKPLTVDVSVLKVHVQGASRTFFDLLILRLFKLLYLKHEKFHRQVVQFKF